MLLNVSNFFVPYTIVNNQMSTKMQELKPEFGLTLSNT